MLYCDATHMRTKMENTQPADLIATSEARKLLGVSQAKMAQLLKQGYLRFYNNPLDRRMKLVSEAEVLSLIPKTTGRAA
jgi:DNA-binding MarR family transcriptional regulator